VAIGGPNSWGWPLDKTLEQIAKLWKLDIRTVSYDQLGGLIRAAREDQAAVSQAQKRADAYLKLPGTKLETDRQYVDNAFLLEQVFRGLMRQFDCRAITVSNCMSTIMPMSQTTACLTLSLLNDAGFLAFCESDFVVIPSGILLGNISGRPTFLNDPTYPHDGIITLAHCTAPRKMDGKNLEPVRILTHYESDYGASPKVEMAVGQKVTNIAPDFASKRWLGLSGEIAAHPFLPICRSQIDVRFKAPSETVAERMPGFHWMTVYGDYVRETAYALRRVPIAWDCLG
jgi:L-fucose isomerase-like protein